MSPFLPTPPSYQPGSGNPKAVRPKAAFKTRRMPSQNQEWEIGVKPPPGGLTRILRLIQRAVPRDSKCLGSPLPDQQTGIFLCAQFFEHFVGQLPRIALDARDQFRPDALESLNGIDVVEADSGRQSWRDVLDQAACEFFQHSLLVERPNKTYTVI